MAKRAGAIGARIRSKRSPKTKKRRAIKAAMIANKPWKKKRL